MRFADIRYRIGTRRLERRRRRFYSRFVRPGDLCFDVGAHVGDRTRVFLALGARVVAVEPQKLCVEKLEHAFAAEPRFTLVEAAVGAESGEAELRVPAEGPALASISAEWIDRVRSSGRFGSQEWTDTVRVRLTTLDDLIAQYGLPEFCKIDVEGYEPEVLAGLGQALPSLSFEFTPEHLDATVRCLDRLQTLAAYEYTYSLGESFVLAESWKSAEELLARLGTLGPRVFGDVYARRLERR